MENLDQGQNSDNQKLNRTNLTKIIFDYDQLDYIKFHLTFSDGFMFGLGIIVSLIAVSIILFLILTTIGISFTNIILKLIM